MNIIKLSFLLSIFLFKGSVAYAQTNKSICTSNLNKAISYLKKEGHTTKDSLEAIKLIKSCVRQNNHYAQLLLGRLYINNNMINDNEIGFKHIMLAAKQEYALACPDLADLYKYGLGCEQNYKKAKKWYKKADDLGNGKGAYGLGYLFYKGLGVKQDYKKAVKWFKKSNHSMAKHWLGVCLYSGFGVKQNKEEGMRLLRENNIENSNIMLDCIKYHERENTQAKIPLESQEIFGKNAKEIVFSENLLDGKWNGTLFKLDWSEKYVEQTFPLSLELKYKENSSTTKYKWNFRNSLIKGEALNENNIFYFEDLALKIPRNYFSKEGEQELKYHISASHFSVKTYKDKEYLIAYLDSYIFDAGEPGNRFALILSKEKNTTINNKNLSSEVLGALSEQKDSFIKLYPNPIEKELYVAYNLDKSGIVRIEITNLRSGKNYVIEKSKQQTSGDYVYYFDASQLKKGYNIVSIYVNEVRHTKTILKK